MPREDPCEVQSRNSCGMNQECLSSVFEAENSKTLVCERNKAESKVKTLWENSIRQY